mmetsp:Transcript_21409/g.27215  ORF Transcript_21409/g.27215 Transcript_21409/m.27215 type:complete len:88 (-) Transcript_21409:473-736(-)
MSGKKSHFVRSCTSCAECTNIFSTGGGTALANLTNIPFIGRIPIDPTLGACMEDGSTFEQKYPESQSLVALKDFVASQLSVQDNMED